MCVCVCVCVCLCVCVCNECVCVYIYIYIYIYAYTFDRINWIRLRKFAEIWLYLRFALKIIFLPRSTADEEIYVARYSVSLVLSSLF